MTLPVRGLGLLAAGVIVLSACSLPPQATMSDKRPIPAPLAVPDLQATMLQVDPARSTLHILVYRGGPMARLGHNHVVSSRTLQGRVWLAARLEDSGFEFSVPVNELIVDDEAARAEHGEDFKQPVSEDAKSGTKANMLRETLLDGARYPVIHIHSVKIAGTSAKVNVTAAIRIKEQTRDVVLPVHVEHLDGALRIQGSFDIRQTDFGITPLSIAGGALLVVDTVQIRFSLYAKKTQSSGQGSRKTGL